MVELNFFSASFTFLLLLSADTRQNVNFLTQQCINVSSLLKAILLHNTAVKEGERNSIPFTAFSFAVLQWRNIYAAAVACLADLKGPDLH